MKLNYLSDIVTCHPWNHKLQPNTLLTSTAVPPAAVRAPSQRPLAPSVTLVTSVTNDKVDNEMIPGAVHRYPGICLTAEVNLGKPQLGDFFVGITTYPDMLICHHASMMSYLNIISIFN